MSHLGQRGAYAPRYTNWCRYGVTDGSVTDAGGGATGFTASPQ